jgi:long-chain fatty acid transport protein
MLFGGGFQLNEHGARAMAQAGAIAARPYDASAVYFNPAGLAFQTKNSVYLGSTFISPEIDFYGPTYIDANKKTSMKNQVFTPINAYVKYGITDDLHFGFGVYNPFGLGTEWDPKWDGRWINTKADLQTFFFTPTLAYKVNDELSFGAGVNIITGGVTITREVTEVPAGANPPTVELDLSGTSFGFNVGLLYKFSESASLGASYRSGSKIEGTGTATFTPNYAAFNLPNGDASGNLELPSTAFIGIAMKPMENLEVEADYQFVGWSSYKELKVDFKKDNSTLVQPKNYEDTYIFRLGGEYTMDALKLRGGYLYDNSPVQPKYVDPILPDADRHGWNIGFGYQVNEALVIDAAYLFLKVRQSTVTNTETGFDGTYNSIANLYAVNIGYTF